MTDDINALCTGAIAAAQAGLDAMTDDDSLTTARIAIHVGAFATVYSRLGALIESNTLREVLRLALHGEANSRCTWFSRRANGHDRGGPRISTSLQPKLKWILISFQAAIFSPSILVLSAAFGVKMPWLEWGRSAL